MKRVQYVDGSFLTADAVADGLLSLVATLGQRGAADVVHVPTVDEFGHVVTQDLVIGPSSQIRSEPESSAFAEPDSAAALEHFDELARSSGIEIARPEPAASATSPTEFWPEQY